MNILGQSRAVVKLNYPKPKRNYDSSRRKIKAERTRQSIINASRDLFFKYGYENSTIQAIAGAANVSVEAVYSIFSNKLSILRELVSTSLVGDFEPVPLLERTFIQENIKRLDPYEIIRNFAVHIFQIMTRMSPVFILLRTTAHSNPEIAVFLNNVLMDRRKGMEVFIDALKANTPLRNDMELSLARDTVFAVSSPEIFDLLTRDLGWTETQYVDWLTDSITCLLLPA